MGGGSVAEGFPYGNATWCHSGFPRSSRFFLYSSQQWQLVKMRTTWYQWSYKIHGNYKWIYSLKWEHPVQKHTDHLLLTISNHLLNVTSLACHQYYCSSKSLLISQYSQKHNKDKTVVESILQRVAEQNVVFLQFCGTLDNYLVISDKLDIIYIHWTETGKKMHISH